MIALFINLRTILKLNKIFPTLNLLLACIIILQVYYRFFLLIIYVIFFTYHATFIFKKYI